MKFREFVKETKEAVAERKMDFIALGLMAVGSYLMRTAPTSGKPYFTPKENLGTALGCVGLGMSLMSNCK